jgi:ParB/RepB/Spo0J family partition protein
MTSDVEKPNLKIRYPVFLPAGKIHVSKVLPKRIHGNELAKSVKQLGVVQPLIVKPLQGCPGEFELIDGHGRLESVQPYELVPVDIVNVPDSEVFQISNATFQRKNRTACEIAEFYESWLQVIIREKGTRDGAQAELAKRANHTEGLISQYLAIHQLFEKLKTLAPDVAFSTLKKWDLNRLYQLSKLLDNPKLLEIAKELENKPETRVEDLKPSVKSIQLTPNEPPISIQVSYSETDQSISAKAPENLPKPTPKKLASLLKKATQILNEIGPKLNGLMLGIETDTEKYSTTQTLTNVRHVLRLLKKLQSYTEMLTQPTSLSQNYVFQMSEKK